MNEITKKYEENDFKLIKLCINKIEKKIFLKNNSLMNINLSNNNIKELSKNIFNNLIRINKINLSNNKLVDMIFIEGTNIMDWIKVIENANGIITVDTCIQYIMEKLDLNYNLFYCYTRTGRKDHLEIIKNLFTIPWNYQTLFEK